MTLNAPSLLAEGRALTSARDLAYGKSLARAQARAAKNLFAAIPGAQIVYRYRIVADGFAIVVPTADAPGLTRIPGIEKVWPNVLYHFAGPSPATTVSHAQAVNQGPQGDRCRQALGDEPPDGRPGNQDRRDRRRDRRPAHVLQPVRIHLSARLPEGFDPGHDPREGDRPAAPSRRRKPYYKFATLPFDPTAENGSFHATHVAGIAAGDHNTQDGALFLSGVAPEAQLGNYKALTIPTPGFGLDGNSAQITAAIEAAVSDGMNIINLSLGEPEISPSRDIVVRAIDAAARAGVVPVIAGDNSFDTYGYGSISSPGNAPDAITVAATTLDDTIASFSSGGPTPVSLKLKPDVSAPGVAITSSLPVNWSGPFGALSGTSMAAPQVSGAVALLMQRHPSWSVQEIKSALVLTGDPVHDSRGHEVSVLREGGGLIDLGQGGQPARLRGIPTPRSRSRRTAATASPLAERRGRRRRHLVGLGAALRRPTRASPCTSVGASRFRAGSR